MAWFDMSYDDEEDVLEVVFTLFDDRFSRTIALNDHVFVFTDLGGRTVWGVTFYSYARLLEVSETEFTALWDVPEGEKQAVLGLLTHPPASLFLELTDPEHLVARVKAPGVEALIRS